MTMGSFSKEQLSKVLEAPTSPYALFEQLSQYEMDACVLLTNKHVSDPELVCSFYSAFLIAHLLVDKMNEGRMLASRVPLGLSGADPTLQNSFILFRAVWQKDHGQVYLILRELPWPSILQNLIHRFELHYQNTTFQDVSKAYDAIRPVTAASYLGFPINPAAGLDSDSTGMSDAVIDTFKASGWEWDADAKLLYPRAGHLFSRK